MLRVALSLALLASATCTWALAGAPVIAEVPADAGEAKPGVSTDSPPALAAMPSAARDATGPETRAHDAELCREEQAELEGDSRRLPLRVSVADADSGRVIRGATWFAHWMGYDDCDIDVTPRDAAEDVEVRIPLRDGPLPMVLVYPPAAAEKEWVRWQEPRFAARASRYARRLVATALLHPEASVFFEATRAGEPVDAGATFRASMTVADRALALRPLERTETGFRLRGVPFVRGAA